MTTFRRSKLFLPISILADTLCLNLAFILAYYLRFKSVYDFLHPPYQLLFWVLNATWFLLLLVVKPYRESRITFNIFKLLYNFLILLAIHASIVAFFWILTKGYSYSRIHLFGTYIIALILGSFLRLIGIIILKKLRQFGYNNRSYIVVGYGELSSSIVNYYNKYPALGYSFKGFFGEALQSPLVKGSYADVQKYITKNSIDYIYCCAPYVDNDTLAQLIKLSETNKIQIKLLVDFRGFLDKGVSIEYHDYLPIINISTKPFSDYRTAILKRTFDLGFSMGLMLVGSPIFLLVALITKITSNGPIFYKSERIGLWGKKFFMYKFRSMVVNSDEIADRLLNGDKHSIGDKDPRVTKWGRIMRKTRLDELPQFLNVIKGDMSVVGPRPLPQYDVDMIMRDSPDDFRRILSIKPGITSMGQIEFGYASTSKENVQRMQYDLDYLENYSFKLDLLLIFRTAQIMLQGKGK